MGDSKIENTSYFTSTVIAQKVKEKKENSKETARWKCHKLSKVNVAQT